MQIVLVHSHLGAQLRDLLRHSIYTNGEMFVGHVPEASLQHFREAYPEHWQELVSAGSTSVPNAFYHELSEALNHHHYRSSR